MDDSPEIDWTRPKHTVRRPLLGITILLVEDSLYCSEAMRLLSIRSGARLRRADSVKSARRHLRIYRPDVMLVDIGLPDGSGLEIIREFSQKTSQLSPIIATSGNSGGNTREDALKAGALFFIEKPSADLASFQQTLLAALPEEIKPLGFVPRLAGACVTPDVQALKDDLDHIDQLMNDCLAENDLSILTYVAQFLGSLGRDANSKRILQASDKLRVLAKDSMIPQEKVRREFQIVHDAVNNRMAQSGQVY